VFQVGSGIIYRGLESERGVAKMGRKPLNFGWAGTDRIPILCIPDENLFTVLQEGEMCVQIDAVLEVKKEIPGKEKTTACWSVPSKRSCISQLGGAAMPCKSVSFFTCLTSICFSLDLPTRCNCPV
jgi:hypothetical protein